jgi:hypothetical protein
MAISEFETKRYERIVGAFVDARRPPPHIRPELDLGYRVTGQSVEIFEIQPVWKGTPGEKMEHPVAKATYVKSRDIWRVFWQRADLKWHRYEPNAEVQSLDGFLEVVERDEYACFFG